MTKLSIPPLVKNAIDNGALLAINHSGGKDSQAMTIKIIEAGIPIQQMLIIHANLAEVEWPGTIEHIALHSHNIPMVIALPKRGFFDMVRKRGYFPTPRYHQCTSDLKRGPITREIRRYLKARPEFGNTVINAMGMRAEESAARRKQSPLRINQTNSVAGRTWIDWLPIHDMRESEVYQTIKDAGETPHWAYQAGMSRLSCSFCIMASKADLQCAAQLRPELLAKYIKLEAEIGHTLSPTGKSLPELLGPQSHHFTQKDTSENAR